MEGACGGGSESVKCPKCGKGVSLYVGIKECPYCKSEIKNEYIKEIIREENKKSFKYILQAIIVVPVIFLFLYLISDKLLQ